MLVGCCKAAYFWEYSQMRSRQFLLALFHSDWLRGRRKFSLKYTRMNAESSQWIDMSHASRSRNKRIEKERESSLCYVWNETHKSSFLAIYTAPIWHLLWICYCCVESIWRTHYDFWYDYSFACCSAASRTQLLRHVCLTFARHLWLPLYVDLHWFKQNSKWAE